MNDSNIEACPLGLIRKTLFRLLAVGSVALSLVCLQPAVGHAAGHIKGLAWFKLFEGEIVIWQISNGSGSVTGNRTVSERCGQECVNETNAVGMGDLNRDGFDDLVWHNHVDGTISAWILNGSRWVAGTQELDWHCAEACSHDWNAFAMGDFNGDGAQDLWWHNDDTGLVGAWLLNGGTIVAGAGYLTEFCGVLDDCLWTHLRIGLSQ